MKKAAVTMAMTLLAVLAAAWAPAGDLEPDTAPQATMHTLQDIYNKLEEIDARMVRDKPTTPDTGSLRAPITGQTQSYAERDDGDLQKGMAWPDPRFTDNGDGTVTDHLTGLIWLKDADCFGQKDGGAAAEAAAAALKDGDCGLSDGSTAGDWRLPNGREQLSLVDISNYNPALPDGHPFINVRAAAYKTSTWSSVNMDIGSTPAGATGYVWPVRGEERGFIMPVK